MSEKLPVHDLIYFDFEKTASIASQLEGGLRKEIQDIQSESGEVSGGLNLQFLNLGGKVGDSKTQLVVKSIHHDLLFRVERALMNERLIVDVNNDFPSAVDDVDILHQALLERPYVRADGICRFHDFERIKNLVNGLNAVIDFVAEAGRENIKKSSAYVQIQQEIAKETSELSLIKDRNKKSEAKRKLKQLEELLEQQIKNAVDQSSGSKLPEWQIQGITKFIDLIVPKRKLLLLQPFEDNPDLTLISNLVGQTASL